eukprot:TRINITY_DN9695_c0_g2_i1.p1 TRINITY_DN9695_c0_g2~~TRINITY_DN9695_c0_g2_i1.p1  ORF type:complete len:146 (+),score=30.12 TRINITY_DN9695_c0_g2_i1:449-886(+)
MLPIQSLTQLEPIDGFRFNVSVQPLDALRVSGTWNYAIVASKRHFDVCMSAFNLAKEREVPCNDFATAEVSGRRGVTAIGSYVLSPKLGLMLKGEGTLRNMRVFNATSKVSDIVRDINYMIELRKILGPIPVSYTHLTLPTICSV